MLQADTQSPRDDLQNLLDKAASADNKIDGVIILDLATNRVYRKSKVVGKSGLMPNSDTFISVAGRSTREIVRNAINLGEGSTLDVRIMTQSSIWTCRPAVLPDKEFLFIFYVHDSDTVDCSGEHESNVNLYKAKIEEILSAMLLG